MAPQTHTRYRVQRLIRLGEWLERNMDVLQLAIDSIDEAHDSLLEASGHAPDPICHADVVDTVGTRMFTPMQILNRLRAELGHGVATRDVQRGKDVTIHHPYAAPGREYEVVMEAPKPKNVPAVVVTESKELTDDEKEQLTAKAAEVFTRMKTQD